MALQKLAIARSQSVRNSCPLKRGERHCSHRRACRSWVLPATGRVVIAAPIAAATWLFSLVISLMFLRGKDKTTAMIGLGRFRLRWCDKSHGAINNLDSLSPPA